MDKFNLYGERATNESQSFFEPFAPYQRSKTLEHTAEERLKSALFKENENNQKLTKTEENQ